MRRQLPHAEILRLRSLVHRGRATPKRVLRSAVRPARALGFLVRQGDNGIVWNILSYWHATDAPTPIERWFALDDDAYERAHPGVFVRKEQGLLLRADVPFPAADRYAAVNFASL